MTEADAAADLAGLPRPVSTYDVQLMAAKLDDLAGLPRPVSTYDVQLMAAKLDDMVANPWSASAMLIVLVSERDALAGRVAELEAALRVSLEALRFDDLPLTQQNVDEWDRLRASAITSARAALSTTPESKP